MKSGIKKRSIVGIVVGLLVAIIPGLMAFNQYRIVTEGEKVTAVITDIISVQTDDGTSYKPEFTYTYNGSEQKYVPNYTASRSLLPKIGSEQKLSISDRGIAVTSVGIGLLGPLIGVGIGLLVMIISIISLVSGIKKQEKITLLKRYGRKVHARFARQEMTNMKVNNQHGVILFFQEEGTDRIYQTHPIYSTYSVKWLEEHLFDVYVDSADPDNYYVDMEKHFGEPVPYS